MTTRHGYRPDIDGLRAIAVTSVVLFHANLPGVSGGFVGVDIFFVISGYLITQLLLREAVQRKTISLAEFYARRVRRLLPALAVVMLTTFVIAHFILLPVSEQPALAKSGVWTAGYASNFYFKTAAANYFAGPVDQQPLLHTWSLAVEEQYYLVWPTLVLVICAIAARVRGDLRSALLTVLVVASAASFALCVHWTTTSPGAAFYLLPARAWELGFGAILAVALEQRRFRNPGLADVVFVAGISIIVVSIVTIDRSTPFPGIAALAPVLGGVCCIAAGALGSSLAVTVLGNRPVVAIGKVSYSWYLWHWPLLALARACALGEPSLSRDLLLALLALGLAVATYAAVENPIRVHRPGPLARANTAIVFGLGLSAFLGGAALGLKWTADRQARDPRYEELATALQEQSPLHAICHRMDLAPLADCTLPGSDPTREIVVWGDSHAELVMAPVAAFGRAHAIPVVQRTSSACPPLRDVVPSNDVRRPNQACAKLNAAVLAELHTLAHSGKHVVAVLGGRWPNYLDTVSPARVATRTLFPIGKTPDESSSELFEAGLEGVVAALVADGIDVIIVGSPPEFAYSPPQCRLRGGDCDIARRVAETYRAPSLSIVQRIVDRHRNHVSLVDPFSAFCDDTTCRPTLEGHLAYQDPHHLTFAAAAKLGSYYEVPLTRALRLGD